MTTTQLEQLKKDGKIRDYKVSAGKTGENAPNQKKTGNTSISEPIGLAHIKQVLEKRQIYYEKEFQFAKPRKFRFDIALLKFKLYVEYDGLMSKKSRHTTKTGFSKDQQKFNLAAANGWTGFRYSVLNYKDFETDLVNFLMNVK